MTRKPIQWTLDDRLITISHPDKILWPGDGITKLQMLEYYRQMGPIMLPYFRKRPATTRFFPEGIEGVAFYRREMPSNAPSWIHGADYQPVTKSEMIRVPTIEDVSSLVWFANHGSIEFHLWASRLPHLDRPDQAIFDLDVGPSVPFDRALQAALAIRDYLKHGGLECYAKTSGGTGLHVYVPLRTGPTFEQVREWVRKTALEIQRKHQNLISVPRGRSHVEGTVTVDYAQNSIGRNTAAPYTLRARPGAPVSAPVTWDEVESGQMAPQDFTIQTMAVRMKQIEDPFRGVVELRQSIDQS